MVVGNNGGGEGNLSRFTADSDSICKFAILSPFCSVFELLLPFDQETAFVPAAEDAEVVAALRGKTFVTTLLTTFVRLFTVLANADVVDVGFSARCF